MQTFINHQTITGSISKGVKINELPYSTSTTIKLKHGDIRDIILTYNNKTVHLISEETVKFMREWGLHRQLYRLKGTYSFDLYRMDHKRNLDTPTPKNTLTSTIPSHSFKFAYACNSREVFTALNQIKNSLLLLKNITPSQGTTKYQKYLREPYTNLLLHYCLQPKENLSQILSEIENKNIPIGLILQELDSSRFKHYLKMIHPSTTWLMPLENTKDHLY